MGSRYQVIQEREAGLLDVKRMSSTEGEPDTFVLVNTYADGWGRHCAKFISTGNPGWDVHVAKAAIMHEVEARREAAPGWVVFVGRLEAYPSDHSGLVRYRER